MLLRTFKLNNNNKRKGNFRIQNKVVLIITNGETEEIYFHNFKKENTNVKIEIRQDAGSDPITLIKFSIRIKGEYDADRVYCVYDVNNTSEESLSEAKNRASKHDMITCVSNPCFELWYLLHFGYSTCHFNSYDDIKVELLGHLPDYYKTKDIHGMIQDNQQVAISRAKDLAKHHKNMGNTLIRDCNPSTQIYEVFEYLIS